MTLSTVAVVRESGADSAMQWSGYRRVTNGGLVWAVCCVAIARESFRVRGLSGSTASFGLQRVSGTGVAADFQRTVGVANATGGTMVVAGLPWGISTPPTEQT